MMDFFDKDSPEWEILDEWNILEARKSDSEFYSEYVKIYKSEKGISGFDIRIRVLDGKVYRMEEIKADSMEELEYRLNRLRMKVRIELGITALKLAESMDTDIRQGDYSEYITEWAVCPDNKLGEMIGRNFYSDKGDWAIFEAPDPFFSK